MSLTEKYQLQLLEQARAIYRDTPITPETERAYLDTPRHVFVPRYRQWGSTTWHDLGRPIGTSMLRRSTPTSR